MRHVFLQALHGLSVQIPPQAREFVIEELDDVEMVVDQNRVGQVFANGLGVGRRHVGRHGPDLGMRRLQLLPKWQ